MICLNFLFTYFCNWCIMSYFIFIFCNEYCIFSASKFTCNLICDIVFSLFKFSPETFKANSDYSMNILCAACRSRNTQTGVSGAIRCPCLSGSLGRTCMKHWCCRNVVSTYNSNTWATIYIFPWKASEYLYILIKFLCLISFLLYRPTYENIILIIKPPK